VGRAGARAEKADSARADWAHVFLSVLPTLPLAAPGDPPAPAGGRARGAGPGAGARVGLHSASPPRQDIRAASSRTRCQCAARGAQALAHHGASLRRAAVAQWEVRLRVPDASGAWRLVISTPTGAPPPPGAGGAPARPRMQGCAPRAGGAA